MASSYVAWTKMVGAEEKAKTGVPLRSGEMDRRAGSCRWRLRNSSWESSRREEWKMNGRTAAAASVAAEDASAAAEAAATAASAAAAAAAAREGEEGATAAAAGVSAVGGTAVAAAGTAVVELDGKIGLVFCCKTA
ncbi:hypothetical protein CLOM_g11617 [Closterium sp. NIES-68]|nr:hypothetical protein CLOM_g11617 [Closterium sp. NIES-68]